MGFAGQLILWDEELCKQIAQRGHYVIRFDNRDVGLSTKIDDAGVPDIMKTIEALMMGQPVNPPYTIEGMGHDIPHSGAWPQIVDAIVDHTHKVDT
jgi:pimeloyl-ACP methyl ester carboxylesterase